MLEYQGAKSLGGAIAKSSAVQDAVLLSSAGGAARGPSISKQRARQLTLASARLRKLMENLKRQHEKRLQVLSGILASQMPPKLSTSLTVSDRGVAISEIDATGKMELDIAVIQAVLRASATSAIREASARRFREGFNQSSLVEKQSDAALTAQFIKLAAQVQEDSFNSLEQATETFPLLASINEKYNGSVLFLLAHELGHIALNHDMTQSLNCARFRTQERQADIYAAVLLADAYGKYSMGEGLDFEFGNYENLTGHNLFFSVAYKMAGFHDNLPNGCSYPAPSERFALLRAVHEKLSSSYQEEIFRQLNTEATEKARKSRTGEFSIEKKL